MSRSSLVDVVVLSPNHSGPRKHPIDTVTIHCMAGDLSAEGCGRLFQDPARRASSNYGIGSDGRIGLYVEEENRSWCSSSSENDNRAVTIEVANTSIREPVPVSDAAYDALIRLLADICRRNGIRALRWEGDPALIGQVERQNMTVHRWFAAKSCPGRWLYERHGEIAAAVNRRLQGKEEDMTREELTEIRGTGDHPSPWHRTACEWAKAQGIFLGDGQGNYGWQQTVTREQIAQAIYNLEHSV